MEAGQLNQNNHDDANANPDGNEEHLDQPGGDEDNWEDIIEEDNENEDDANQAQERWEEIVENARRYLNPAPENPPPGPPNYPENNDGPDPRHIQELLRVWKASHIG